MKTKRRGGRQRITRRGGKRKTKKSSKRRRIAIRTIISGSRGLATRVEIFNGRRSMATIAAMDCINGANIGGVTAGILEDKMGPAGERR